MGHIFFLLFCFLSFTSIIVWKSQVRNMVDIIVIGGGHAGIEAALAASRMGM